MIGRWHEKYISLCDEPQKSQHLGDFPLHCAADAKTTASYAKAVSMLTMYRNTYGTWLEQQQQAAAMISQNITNITSTEDTMFLYRVITVYKNDKPEINVETIKDELLIAANDESAKIKAYSNTDTKWDADFVTVHVTMICQLRGAK